MAKAGDRDVFSMVITTEDVLSVMGAVELTAGSMGAMITAAKTLMARALQNSKFNAVTFVGSILLGAATTAIQTAYQEEIEALKDIHIKFYLEAKEVKIHKQGKIFTIIKWQVVDYSLSVY